jgi:hypothetical protein
VTSTAKKMDSTRHGFAPEPPARPVAGAFAREGRNLHREPGTETTKTGRAAALRAMAEKPKPRSR